MWNGGIVHIIHPRPHPVTLRNQKLLEGFEQGMSMISLTFFKNHLKGETAQQIKDSLCKHRGRFGSPHLCKGLDTQGCEHGIPELGGKEDLRTQLGVRKSWCCGNSFCSFSQ